METRAAVSDAASSAVTAIGGRAANGREHRLVGWAAGIVAELALFAGTLAVFQLSGYGHQPGRLTNVPLGLLFVVVAWGVAEACFRLYRRAWAVAGFTDAIAIAWAVAVATVLITAANSVLPDSIRPFRYLVPVLAAPAVAAAISLYRLWPRLRAVSQRGSRRLIVVAPDSAAFPWIRWMVLNAPSGWEPVAILTMEGSDRGRTVLGVPVVGRGDEIARRAAEHRADGVAFIPRGPLTTSWKDLVGQCLDAELPIFIVPEPEDTLHGRTGAEMRSLTADDLVGRETREIDLANTRECVQGRTVMVTGAAGSIGSELSRLVAGLTPARLVLVDNNESGLFQIVDEVRTAEPGLEVREALVSIVERDLLMRVFTEERPAVVFHAAAYKHVPLLEAHPEQAISTNVLGTYNMLSCAAACGTASFVLVSTDKAVSRHSIMGASKRLCEMLVLAMGDTTNCWAVRFGNVVGSRGSVVPTFERQIQNGGPVTITHPDATRYLMTIREAASLVISTLTLGRPGHLYMLDMGTPVSIESLARSLIRSRGLEPGREIKIVYTGLRPGESLTEDLLAPDEGWRPTQSPAVREVLSPSPLAGGGVGWLVERIHTLLEHGERDELVSLLRGTVTGAVVPRRGNIVGMASEG